MSRKGNCWDNAVAQSFFATLKVEFVHETLFQTRAQATRDTFEYIEVFYNRVPRHSLSGLRQPDGVREKRCSAAPSSLNQVSTKPRQVQYNFA
jgi:putative transposase